MSPGTMRGSPVETQSTLTDRHCALLSSFGARQSNVTVGSVCSPPTALNITPNRLIICCLNHISTVNDKQFSVKENTQKKLNVFPQRDRPPRAKCTKTAPLHFLLSTGSHNSEVYSDRE